MNIRLLLVAGGLLGASLLSSCSEDETSNDAGPDDSVVTLYPEGAIEPTGTWNLGTRAGDFIYIAGMRGIDPETNELVEGDEQRVRQGFLNMQHIAQSEGADLSDATRIVVYVTDMEQIRPIVNAVQEEMWEGEDYPPRTILEVSALNEADIFEVEGTFYAPEG